ncbi:hypothetical protein CJ483_21040 [Bacillus sp. PK3_68]|nr:hypothetical protein CJ483_21040 [Bacillus sp. PK3_68]
MNILFILTDIIQKHQRTINKKNKPEGLFLILSFVEYLLFIGGITKTFPPLNERLPLFYCPAAGASGSRS